MSLFNYYFTAHLTSSSTDGEAWTDLVATTSSMHIQARTWFTQSHAITVSPDPLNIDMSVLGSVSFFLSILNMEHSVQL